MYSRGENLYYFTIGLLGIGVLIFANFLISNKMNETFGLFIILTLLGLIIQKFGEIKIEDLIITLDTSVIFACYFLMGIVPTLWLSIFIVGIYGILFESKPKRKVFNNAGMFTLIYFIAHYIFMAMKQSLMASVLVNVYINVTVFGLLVFILNWCFMILQIIITIGSFPKWLNESLKWDFYTNIVVIPLAILLINSYNNYGYFGITLISILVFVVILFFRLIRNLVFMNNELRVVYEVSATISSKLDLNETISSILKGIEELVFCDFSIIFEYNVDAKKMEAIECKVSKEMIVDFKKLENLINSHIDELMGYKKGFVVENVKRNKQIKETKQFLESVSSFIYQPLIQDDKVVGCIFVSSGVPNKFSNQQLKILDLLANQAVIALENAKEYRNIKNKAIRDSLTGLFNQRHFYDSLDKISSNCDNCYRKECDKCDSISLILFDIDYFKSINDTYGHQTGDKVLKEIAKILKNNVRNKDQVYRYGGEEFAILLPNTNEEQAQYIANRIRKAVENNNFVGFNGESIKITISGGISSFPKKATSGSVLLSHADRAMYTGAKQKGRNKVCIYGN